MIFINNKIKICFLFVIVIFVITGCHFNNSFSNESNSDAKILEKRFKAESSYFQIYYIGDTFDEKFKTFKNARKIKEEDLQTTEIDGSEINYLFFDQDFTNTFLADKEKFLLLDNFLENGVFVYFQSKDNSLINRVEILANNGKGTDIANIPQSKDGAQMHVWLLRENGSYIKAAKWLNDDNPKFAEELLFDCWRYRRLGY